MVDFERNQAEVLRQRLKESPRTMNVVAGPRQVGKTTLVTTVLAGMKNKRFVSADPSETGNDFMPSSGGAILAAGSLRDERWLVDQWQQARLLAARDDEGFILAIDEIQKVPRWSEVIKGLWDADRTEKIKLKIILLGSSPLLMHKGLNESLAGRFEPIHLSHWTYPEMHDAFGLALDEFIYFGGYPGSANYIKEEPRWRQFVHDSLIEPAISKDILAMNRVDKPPLLRELFRLGCSYSGQIMALSKMAPHLQDDGEKGHTSTLAHYLDLLTQAGMLAALQKYSASKLRQRGSKPKLIALNTAMMSLEAGYDFAAARQDRTHWGRLVETAVGAHLVNSSMAGCQVFYWSEGSTEVDFVIARGRLITAVEVKSGRKRAHMRGFEAFEKKIGPCKRLVVGEDGIPLPELFSYPAEHWL